METYALLKWRKWRSAIGVRGYTWVLILHHWIFVLVKGKVLRKWWWTNHCWKPWVSFIGVCVCVCGTLRCDFWHTAPISVCFLIAFLDSLGQRDVRNYFITSCVWQFCCDVVLFLSFGISFEIVSNIHTLHVYMWIYFPKFVYHLFKTVGTLNSLLMKHLNYQNVIIRVPSLICSLTLQGNTYYF